MAEYSLKFAEHLVRAAEALEADAAPHIDRSRAILYLSLLSAEITLKALLERAGTPVKQIRALSHDLNALQKEIGRCEVPLMHSTPHARWIRATGIRAKSIKVPGASSTVGVFLSSEAKGASKYPNNVRYGEKIKHFPPHAALEGARVILKWAHEHWTTIRRP
jgi:hypothetical protein